ncbi:MAG: hypothetical protein HS126_19295 [Anaerolineales bacterium]|nr:hypothetical protein [Anaerolineales bacterium]
MERIKFNREFSEALIRHLQILKMKKAYKGIDTEPQILMGIEDIEKELRKLNEEYLVLMRLELDKQQSQERFAKIKESAEMSFQKLQEIIDSFYDRLNERIIRHQEETESLLKLISEQQEMLDDFMTFFLCPYCHSFLSAFVEQKVSYKCGYSALIQVGELIQEGELTSHEDVAPCPNKTPNQEKWDEDWWKFFDRYNDE